MSSQPFYSRACFFRIRIYWRGSWRALFPWRASWSPSRDPGRGTTLGGLKLRRSRNSPRPREMLRNTAWPLRRRQSLWSCGPMALWHRPRPACSSSATGLRPPSSCPVAHLDLPTALSMQSASLPWTPGWSRATPRGQGPRTPVLASLWASA